MIDTEVDVYTTILRKGNEHYIFVYDRNHLRQLLFRLGKMAMNPELSFGWYDAARVSAEVRKP